MISIVISGSVDVTDLVCIRSATSLSHLHTDKHSHCFVWTSLLTGHILYINPIFQISLAKAIALLQSL